MNYLSIDYGSKRIGLALSVSGIIEPFSVVKNDQNFLNYLNNVLQENRIDQIFVGVSEGSFAKKTLEFVADLKTKVSLPIETVEEAVSTIEADKIFTANKKSLKKYKSNIDAIAAAVILQRVII